MYHKTSNSTKKMEKKYYFLKRYEPQKSADFADIIAATPFDQLTATAKAELATWGLNIDIDTESAFISSGDIIGFYFPNTRIKDARTGFRLKCVAIRCGYSFEERRKKAAATVLFVDGNGAFWRPCASVAQSRFDNFLQKKVDELQEIAAYAAGEIAVLQSIKRRRKKDGGNFYNLRQNLYVCAEGYTSLTVEESRDNVGRFCGWRINAYAAGNSASLCVGESDPNNIDAIFAAIEQYQRQRAQDIATIERKKSLLPEWCRAHLLPLLLDIEQQEQTTELAHLNYDIADFWRR